MTLLGGTRKIPNGVFILNGHYISRDDVESDVFYNLLNNLNTKCTFIRIQDAVKLIEENKSVNCPYIAFTFDDGFQECFTKIAPVLEQFDTNAALFINPNFITGDDTYKAEFLREKVHIQNKEPLTRSEIKILAGNGHVIGSHTMDHLRLSEVDSKDALQYQIVQSKKEIEGLIDGDCEFFAWPYGANEDISEDALRMASEHYKYLFSSIRKPLTNDQPNVFNRHHFEGNWNYNQLKYILSN